MTAHPKAQSGVTALATTTVTGSQTSVGLAPRTMEEGIKIANMLAKSTLVPKDFQNNPANIYIALQWGAELGLAPMQALQSIAVINGRPSIFGDGLLAVVMASGLLEYIKEPPVTDGIAMCEVQRKGWPEPRTVTFSVADAKQAGLWDKQGPWRTYPNRMLQMRARGWALRDTFADVLRGVAVAEEVQDMPEKQVNAQVVGMPRRLSEVAAPERQGEDAPDTPSPDEPTDQPAAASEPDTREASPGPQPTEESPKDAATAETVIAEADRRTLFAEARKSGRSVLDIKAYVKETYGIESTKQIPVDTFPEILTWARTPVREPGEDDA